MSWIHRLHQKSVKFLICCIIFWQQKQQIFWIFQKRLTKMKNQVDAVFSMKKPANYVSTNVQSKCLIGIFGTIPFVLGQQSESLKISAILLKEAAIPTCSPQPI